MERVVIGVTGRYAAGKSTVRAHLEKRGFLAVDVDALGHQALDLRRAEVIREFSEAVLGPSGEIDRAELGRVVFSDGAALQRLEAIVHPPMRGLVEQAVAANPARRICIDAALLVHMRLHELCGAIIWVESPLPLRLIRARRRDRRSFSELLRRFRSQQDTVRAQDSDHPVDLYRVKNGLCPRRLDRRVDDILQRLGVLNEGDATDGSP